LEKKRQPRLLLFCLYWDVSSAGTVVGFLFFCLIASAETAVWRGINYSPRGHAYWRMLADWQQIDHTSGKPVSQLVEADLTLLKQSGVNALHLYLWDQPSLDKLLTSKYLKRRETGFAFPDPKETPQLWQALNEYISAAERHQLGVILHFAHLTFNDGLGSEDLNGREGRLDDLSPTQIHARSQEIVEWGTHFITGLDKHPNIVGWGSLYAAEPAPTDDVEKPNVYSQLWREVYVGLHDTLLEQKGALAPPLVTYLYTPPDHKNGGWDVETSQQRYRSMQEHLHHQTNGKLKQPDLVYTFLFGADPRALAESLQQLGSGANAVPLEKLFIAEFGVSSPFGSSATPRMALGENSVPTTDLAGQAAWLKETLCHLQRTGVRGMAYWTLYDAEEFWRQTSNMPADELSLNGHWGLAQEEAKAGFKPAWQVLEEFYRGKATCSLSAGKLEMDPKSGFAKWSPHLDLPSSIKPKLPETSAAPKSTETLKVLAVVSSADFAVAAPTGGSLMSIFVEGLTDIDSLWQASALPLPTEYKGLRVSFRHGDSEPVPAALLAVAPVPNVRGRVQINVQVPWPLCCNNAEALISQSGKTGSLSVAGVLYSISIFGHSFRNSDRDSIAVNSQNQNLITRSTPARSGQLVTVYLTGLKISPGDNLQTGFANPPGEIGLALPPAIGPKDEIQFQGPNGAIPLT
jgi:uncharacterized protein (TIGR03437 family)